MTFARQILLPFAAVFQVAGSSLPQIYDWGVNVGERSRALDTAIIPAGWAFSIWGLIFLWSLLFAGYAATRSGDKVALVDRVALPAALAFLANGVWGLYTPLFGLNIGSEIIIVIGLLSAVSAALIAGRHPMKSVAQNILVAAPLGLLAGWLTAASFVGGSSVLLGLGVDISNPVLLGFLTGATLVAAIIIWSGASLAYSAALLWALSAIIEKNLDDGNQIILVAAAIALVVILAASALRPKR